MDEQQQSATPNGPTPEAVQAVAEAEAQRTEKLERHLRETWGGDESGYQRGLAAIAHTEARLNLREGDTAELELMLSPESIAELGAKAGAALAVIPEDLTPAEARSMIDDLCTDAEFFARLQRGERRALRYWDGLTWLAARGEQS